MTAADSLKKIKEGNERYVQDVLTHPNSDNTRKASQTGGQSPFAIVLSCADSRVVPELIFDQGIGDLFVIRVAGNTANASSIASIEYAVAHLGTKLIVVLGHESCGACGAAVAGGDNGPNLNHLLDMIQPAVDKSENKEVNDVVKINAAIQAEELVNQSKIIANAVENSGVEIVSAYYNLNGGKVNF
ncbi:MAG: carbonic anhydrase [Crocinitomicaceae bacterium]|nr:carbonic anhydrase [Crocinitomicaceae bacterium]|tara:strand:- start:1153 stop:1713 length:561 start_codon:yes stop_codon:yes gene_type:complete